MPTTTANHPTSENTSRAFLTNSTPCPARLTSGTDYTASPTTQRRLTINDKRYLLRRRPGGTHALFARVGSRWSGGVIYASDRSAVAAATGIPADRIV